MATHQISHQLSAVAGMATNPLSPVAKAAEKHAVGVIQAKSQMERHAAIRRAAREQARDSRMPRYNAQHGKHIWIYTMARTKRVIYSLTKEIDDAKARAQITFIGKKSVPAAIRPDLWSALAIVTFPSAQQGLEAYRFLREFRMRHEYEWRQHLEDKNNLPAFRKKVRMLQNQKPNSIADLAATLALQGRLGREEIDRRLAQLREKEEAYDIIMKEIGSIDAELEKAESAGDDKDASRLRLKRKALETPTSRELSRHHVAAARALENAQKEADSQDLSSVGQAEGGQSPREAFIQRRRLELLPSALSELRTYFPLPKRGSLRKKMMRELIPSRNRIPTLNGVSIMWADSNDRKYAESWPEEVDHATMGVRYGTAPMPEELLDHVQQVEEEKALLAKFEPREEEMFARNLAEWRVSDEDVGSFIRYLQIRQALARRSIRDVQWKNRRGHLTDDAVEAAELKATASDLALGAVNAIAYESASEDQQEGKCRELLARDSIREATELRISAAKLLEEDASRLETALAEAERSVKAVGTPDLLAELRVTPQYKRGLDWYGHQHLGRVHAVLAKKDSGSNLTPEEEEMLKNVELDGESSGKNEDDSGESEAQELEEGKTGEQQDVERMQKRQQEEKKSLWGRLFSGSGSSSSKDGQPRA